MRGESPVADQAYRKSTFQSGGEGRGWMKIKEDGRELSVVS